MTTLVKEKTSTPYLHEAHETWKNLKVEDKLKLIEILGFDEVLKIETRCQQYWNS